MLAELLLKFSKNFLQNFFKEKLENNSFFFFFFLFNLSSRIWYKKRDPKGPIYRLRGQHFELIPFGSGRRMCPGTSLALQVVQVNLGVMIQCFDWIVEGGKDKVDMEEKPGLTLARAHPLLCVLSPRLSPFPSLSL